MRSLIAGLLCLLGVTVAHAQMPSTQSIIFLGSISGTATITAPAVAGTTIFTLPGTMGTSGYCLVTNGAGLTSWAACGGGGGGSGITIGSTTVTSGTSGYVLFNNGGVVGNISTSGSGSVVLGSGASIYGAAITSSTGSFSSLSDTSVTGSTQCLQANSAGLISGTGAACGSGGGGGSGTVTSVGLTLPGIFSLTGSPVTTSGTIAATLASETANTIFAAPNGSSGAPTFRAMVNADLPAITGSGSVVLAVSPALTGTATLAAATVSGNLMLTSLTGSTQCLQVSSTGLVAATGAPCGSGGGGGITSVGLTLPSIFASTNNPLTVNGNIGITLATQSAGTVFAAPSGGGAPVFRAIVSSDLPTALAGTTTGTTQAQTDISTLLATDSFVAQGPSSATVTSPGTSQGATPVTAQTTIITGGSAGSGVTLLCSGTGPYYRQVVLNNDTIAHYVWPCSGAQITSQGTTYATNNYVMLAPMGGSAAFNLASTTQYYVGL